MLDAESDNNNNIEMADAESDDNSNNNYSSDDPDTTDEYEEDDSRDRILNWTFTASSLASQGPEFQVLFHHLREAFNRQDNRDIEFQLHRLMPVVFELNDDDAVNISRDEFSNLNFRLQSVRDLRGEGPLDGVNNGFDATLRTADGMHAVRVQLPIYPREHGPLLAGPLLTSARPAIVVKYMGFLNFRGHSNCGGIVRDWMFPPRL